MNYTLTNSKLSIDLTTYKLKNRQRILTDLLTLTHKDNYFVFIISGLDLGLEQIYVQSLSDIKKIKQPEKKGLFKPLKKLYLVTRFEADIFLVIEHLDDFNEGEITATEVVDFDTTLDSLTEDMADYIKKVEIHSDASYFTISSHDKDYLHGLVKNIGL